MTDNRATPATLPSKDEIIRLTVEYGHREYMVGRLSWKHTDPDFERAKSRRNEAFGALECAVHDAITELRSTLDGQYALTEKFAREIADSTPTLRAPEVAETPIGTYSCPICGMAEPHAHPNAHDYGEAAQIIHVFRHRAETEYRIAQRVLDDFVNRRFGKGGAAPTGQGPKE